MSGCIWLQLHWLGAVKAGEEGSVWLQEPAPPHGILHPAEGSLDEAGKQSSPGGSTGRVGGLWGTRGCAHSGI